LTHQQVDGLARKSRYPVVVAFLAYTGLRSGEATGLRVKDFDPLRRRVNVDNNAVTVGSAIIEGSPKDSESRSLPYPAFLDLALKAQARDKHPRQLLLGNGWTHMPLPHSKSGWLLRAVGKVHASDPSFP
jgi:integrase